MRYRRVQSSSGLGSSNGDGHTKLCRNDGPLGEHVKGVCVLEHADMMLLSYECC